MTGRAVEDRALVGVASTIAAIAEAATELGNGAPATAATKSAPARVSRGDRRDRYERLGLLGEGGMGRVERVLDHDLMREVAVKELRPELRREGRLLAQFLWEARVTAHLDHPNIVPVHDMGVSPSGHLYFTMKFVRGTSVEQYIDALAEGTNAQRERSLSRRLRMFLHICNAVGYAHAKGVLHRDLKPANVMLGDHGEVLVTDWGLAIPLPGPKGEALREQMPSGLSRSGSGTPVYMSPEQANEFELDERSDIYTLGAILYEMVTLRRPFDAPTVPALLAKVRAGEREPMEIDAPSLAAIIDKAMALDPADRYQIVSSLADDVETVLDGRTPVAESASVVKQAARFYVSHDPAMSQLRVIDIDLWTLGMFAFGTGAGLLAANWIAWSWWLWLVGGALVSIPPTMRYLANRRAARAAR